MLTKPARQATDATWQTPIITVASGFSTNHARASAVGSSGSGSDEEANAGVTKLTAT